MTGWRVLLLVALGGALGSVGRYVTGIAVQRIWPATGPLTALPVGTVTVNILGSLLIGLLAGTAELRHGPGAAARLFLVVGVLGGFTTFSAFSLENLLLMRAGQVGLAAANVVLQVGLGFAAVAAGFYLARSFPA